MDFNGEAEARCDGLKNCPECACLCELRHLPDGRDYDWCIGCAQEAVGCFSQFEKDVAGTIERIYDDE